MTQDVSKFIQHLFSSCRFSSYTSADHLEWQEEEYRYMMQICRLLLAANVGLHCSRATLFSFPFELTLFLCACSFAGVCAKFWGGDSWYDV